MVFASMKDLLINNNSNSISFKYSTHIFWLTGFICPEALFQDFSMARKVRNLPVMQETRIRSLGWEDLLEKGMATHSSILAWRIPRTKRPGGLQSVGLQRVGHD